jgi:hypothetical protein
MQLLIRPSEIGFWLNSDADALTPLLEGPQDIPLVITS